MGGTNRKEKVVQGVLKYWQRLWEMVKISLLGDALKEQSLENGNNWLNKIKQKSQGIGMGDI
jgi:hypothetical protein